MRIICSVLFLVVMLQAANAVCEDKSEILIGTHLPLTGMMADVGKEQKWAYEEAVRDINNQGGIFVSKYNQYLPVRLVVIDDETNPAVAAAAVERLITQNNVDVILGGHTAAFGVIPGCVIAEKHRMYYHATACYGDLWLEHKFKYSTLFFYDLHQSAEIPFKIWAVMPEDARPHKIGILAEDTFDARIMMDTLRIKAFDKGYAVVVEEYWVPQTENYDAIAAALKSSDADSLFIMGTTSDCIKLISKIRAYNIPLKYIHCWRGAWSARFWDQLRNDSQYIFFDGHWSDEYPYAMADVLGRRYQSEFADKSVSVGTFYAAAQILFQAIEKAGSLEPQKIRNSVVNGKFDTVMGPVQYNDAGIAYYESIAFQWVNGKPRLIYPFNLAAETGYLRTESHEKK